MLVERGFVIATVVRATRIRLILSVWHGTVKVPDSLSESGSGASLVALEGKTNASNLKNIENSRLNKQLVSRKSKYP